MPAVPPAAAYCTRLVSPGSFCISIDVERAWGIWDKPSPEYFRRCLATETHIISGLVELFDRYEIAATWAIVGRLLERDSTRPGDPGLWYAPESLDRIVSARHRHEIGSHSYAHVYYGQVDRDTAYRDLAAARRIHQGRGLEFVSFVFPRDDVSHLDVLAAQGIKVFRSIDYGFPMTVRRRLGRTPGRIANLLDNVLPISPTAVRPIVHASGLVELPTSMLFMSRHGARVAIHPRSIELKAQFGFDAAARSGGVFHLRFHPSNFYYDTERQLGLLERILTRARTLREVGKIAIRTMGSFAPAQGTVAVS
jgi:peptidoglycan/xylan/chitin deacetylase (PgdA/CDA1 family)